jgi:hypothetical protein
MGTMGAGVADLDNNGFLDIYFGTGDPQMTRLEPNRIFRNNGAGGFTDWTQAVIERPGNKGHGVTFIDIDNDGGLDIYAQLGGHYPGDMARNAFYRNLAAGGNHWLQLDVERHIGAQVTVKAGGMTFYREGKGSEGFGATNPPRFHFGLGKNTVVDSIGIRWPDGTVRRIEAVGVDRVIVVQAMAGG